MKWIREPAQVLIKVCSFFDSRYCYLVLLIHLSNSHYSCCLLIKKYIYFFFLVLFPYSSWPKFLKSFLVSIHCTSSFLNLVSYHTPLITPLIRQWMLNFSIPQTVATFKHISYATLPHSSSTLSRIQKVCDQTWQLIILISISFDSNTGSLPEHTWKPTTLGHR